jgi:hypothetical protein
MAKSRTSYETALTPSEEQQFAQWKLKYAPNDSGADYDLRGAFKAGLTPDAKSGHWPDTFKKPNHPTFSPESVYHPNNVASPLATLNAPVAAGPPKTLDAAAQRRILGVTPSKPQTAAQAADQAAFDRSFGFDRPSADQVIAQRSARIAADPYDLDYGEKGTSAAERIRLSRRTRHRGPEATVRSYSRKFDGRPWRQLRRQSRPLLEQFQRSQPTGVAQWRAEGRKFQRRTAGGASIRRVEAEHRPDVVRSCARAASGTARAGRNGRANDSASRRRCARSDSARNVVWIFARDGATDHGRAYFQSAEGDRGIHPRRAWSADRIRRQPFAGRAD